MWNKIRSILLVSVLVFSGFVVFWNFGMDEVVVEGATLYVGPTSTYKYIQDAIDNASSGDIIYVDNGTYYESVTITTSGITLIGNSSTDCKIIHHYTGTSFSDYAAGFNISANYVNITGFNISVSGDYTFGIYLKSTSNNSSMINNNIKTTGSYGFGIFIEFSNNNKIIGNTIRTTNSSGYGIILYYSSNNNLTSNTINTLGFGSGIYIQENSVNNSIIDNIIYTTDVGGRGITLDLCVGNTLAGNVINTIGDKGLGFFLDGASNNNFIGNIIKTVSTSINIGAKSINNNFIGNIINSTGDLSGGITSAQNIFNNTFTDNIINTTGDSSPGIELGVNNKEYDIINNTITTSGSKSYGIYLRTSSNNNNLIDNTINTSGQDGYGIYLFQNSNNNNLNGNTINTTGLDGYAIYLEQSSNNKNITDNNINTSGSRGYGIYLDQSSNNKNINGNTINTFGSDGKAIYIDHASNNNINDNTIRTNDQGAIGIHIWDYSTYNNLTGNLINTTGASAYGIYLYSSCTNNNLIGNIINISGLNSWGIYVRVSSRRNNITGNTIETSGMSGYGIIIYSDSDNNSVKENKVKTYETNAHGIYIVTNSNDVNITNNTIVTTQSGARGINIESSNNVNVFNCNISTVGSNAQGIRLWGMVATIEGTTISSSNGNDIDIQNDGNITAINCSFKTVESIKGTLLVLNYLTVQAYYNDTFSPISGADVMVEDNSQVVYQSTGYGGADPQTNAVGRTDKMLIMDRWYKYSNTAFENITNIHVKKSVDLSWEENRKDVNMSTSHTEVFISSNIIAPSTPTGLMISQVPGTNNLTISWNQNPEVDIINYTVYSNRTGQWSVLVNITYPQTSTLDTDLPDETWYFYQIQAWDIVDLSSGISSPVGYYLADTIPPAMPKGFTAGSVPGGDAINVSWNLNTDDTIKYDLWWRESPTGSWVHLGNFSSTTSWFILEDDSLVNGSKHYFRLRAWDDLDNPSNFTPNFEVTHRDYEPPEGPTNLIADAISETEINLIWSASPSSDVEKYWIYINQPGSGTSGPYQFKGEVNGQTLEYQVSGLLENRTYYFVVKALDEANNPSINSNEAKDTTLAVPPNSPILDTLPAITNKQILNVTGKAELGVMVLIFNTNNEAGNGTTNATGGFSIKITLVEGDNDIKARAIDQAELPSLFSAVQTVRLDITNPIANAGNDINVTEGTVVTFNGSASTDNYEIVNYTWSFDYDGVSIKLYGSNPGFNFNESGDYEVTLSVTDGAGNIGKDTVMAHIAKKVIPDNIPPIANAGVDKAIKTGQKVTFDGSGSTDDTGISNYTWTFTYNGSEIVLYGVSPSFVFEIEGNYKITLTVIDLAVPPNMDTDTMWVNVTKAVVDTDGDNMPDEWEDKAGLNKNDPTDATKDADSDELNNLDEYNSGTDPNDPDSDNDELPDGWEVDNGLNPMNPLDAEEDLDGDDFTNLEEFKAGTNPNDPNDKPKEVEVEDDNEKEVDNTFMYLILAIVIIIIILLLIFGLTRGKKGKGAETEPAAALADEEAEEPMDDEGSELEDEDVEDIEEPEFDEELEVDEEPDEDANVEGEDDEVEEEENDEAK